MRLSSTAAVYNSADPQPSPACRIAHKSFCSIHIKPEEAKAEALAVLLRLFAQAQFPPVDQLGFRTISYAMKLEGASGFAAEPFAQMEELRAHLHTFACVCVCVSTHLTRPCSAMQNRSLPCVGVNPSLLASEAVRFASIAAARRLGSTSMSSTFCCTYRCSRAKLCCLPSGRGRMGRP